MYFMKRFLMYLAVPPLVIGGIGTGIYGLMVLEDHIANFYSQYTEYDEFFSGLTMIVGAMFVWFCIIAAAHDAACKED